MSRNRFVPDANDQFLADGDDLLAAALVPSAVMSRAVDVWNPYLAVSDDFDLARVLDRLERGRCPFRVSVIGGHDLGRTFDHVTRRVVHTPGCQMVLGRNEVVAIKGLGKMPGNVLELCHPIHACLQVLLCMWPET